MLYAAEHLSLPCLEILVHIDKSQLPRDYVWSETRLSASPSVLALQGFSGAGSRQSVGKAWVTEANQLAIQVPLFVVPEEWPRWNPVPIVTTPPSQSTRPCLRPATNVTQCNTKRQEITSCNTPQPPTRDLGHWSLKCTDQAARQLTWQGVDSMHTLILRSPKSPQSACQAPKNPHGCTEVRG